MIDKEKLKGDLMNLSLHIISDIYEEEAKEAAKMKLSYTAYLARLIEQESSGKTERSIKARIAKAKFPGFKTIEGFDFSFQPGINETLIRELGELSFLRTAHNIIFIGPPGVGKTHLAVGIGIKACESRKKVLFSSALSLMDSLIASLVDHSIGNRLRTLGRLDLLIIDELGYMPMDKERANIFFQLISKRYEKGSVIITTNKSFDEWGEIFGDEVIAGAILDRLIHHSYIIPINGPSWRTKDKMKVKNGVDRNKKGVILNEK